MSSAATFFLVEAAEPAVDVAERRSVEPPADERQHRVSDRSGGARAGSALSDPALEPVATDEVISLPQAADEWLEVGEVVAVVGVAHDHPATSCCGNAACECGTVPALRDRDDASPELFRDLAGAVGRAVVRDHDLSQDSQALEGRLSLADADPDLARASLRHGITTESSSSAASDAAADSRSLLLAELIVLPRAWNRLRLLQAAPEDPATEPGQTHARS